MFLLILIFLRKKFRLLYYLTFIINTNTLHSPVHIRDIILCWSLYLAQCFPSSIYNMYIYIILYIYIYIYDAIATHALKIWISLIVDEKWSSKKRTYNQMGRKTGKRKEGETRKDKKEKNGSGKSTRSSTFVEKRETRRCKEKVRKSIGRMEGGNTGAAATSALRPLHKCNVVHRAARSSLFRFVPDCQTFSSIQWLVSRCRVRSNRLFLHVTALAGPLVTWI